LRDFLVVVEIAAEGIEPLVPEAFVAGHPHRRLLQWRSIELAAHHAAFFRARDEPGRLEHRQVFHEAGERHAVRQRQLADRAGAVFQLAQHAAARDIGERSEHGIEAGLFKLNHLVQY